MRRGEEPPAHSSIPGSRKPPSAGRGFEQTRCRGPGHMSLKASCSTWHLKPQDWCPIANLIARPETFIDGPRVMLF